MPTKTDDSSSGSIETQQTLSELFKQLSHHRRRIAVQYLATQAGAAPVSDVADQIALLEGEHTRDRYERICTSLVHAHLPMLANGGAINYDPDREIVELREQAMDMLPYIELITGDD